MAIGLRDRVTMSSMALAAQLVSPLNRAVRRLSMDLQPRTKSWAEIETQRFIIIAHINDRTIQDVRLCISVVAFTENPFVPIWKGCGARLTSDNSGPWTFARRLIEVAMNYEITRFSHYLYSSLIRAGS